MPVRARLPALTILALAAIGLAGCGSGTRSHAYDRAELEAWGTLGPLHSSSMAIDPAVLQVLPDSAHPDGAARNRVPGTIAPPPTSRGRQGPVQRDMYGNPIL